MQTIAGRPADSLDSIPAHLAIQMQERDTALKTLAKLRRQARDEIDRLIRFLDESDLDPDLEDTGDDEPSLGWTTGGSGQWAVEDCELDDGDDEDNGDREDSGDREPSLGWTVDGYIGSSDGLDREAS